MSWFLNCTWGWFKWFWNCFFYWCFLNLIIIQLIIDNFLGLYIIVKFLFPKITFELYLRLNKRLCLIIVILNNSSFLLICNCNWTLWNGRISLFNILLFNWCVMTLSQIILIVRSKRLIRLIIFILLRRWDFEVLIIILRSICILCINVACNRLVLLVFVHQTELMVLFLVLVLVRVVLDWRLRLGLSVCF